MDNMSTDTTYPRFADRNVTAPRKSVATRCDRCGGSGVYHTYGVCFRCGGNGVDPTYRDWGYPAAWTDEQCAEFDNARRARNDARRIAKQDKRQAEVEAARSVALARYPILAAMDEIRQAAGDDGLQRHPSGIAWCEMPSFALDIFWQGYNTASLTDRQADALTKAMRVAAEQVVRTQDRAAERAAAAPVPTGRVRIEGEIVSLKWYDGDYGSTLKAMIKGDEGWRVFVSVPTKLVVEVGDRINLTCTITAVDDDPTFGKGKRPTGGEVL